MPAAQVARAMARRLAPDEDSDPPPGWLRPEQVRSFRRALHALRRYGGALLADPVGSGKTYVALAVAAALDPGRPTACLVPATLVEQWRATAAGLGAARSSRARTRRRAAGRLPDVGRGLVRDGRGAPLQESRHLALPARRAVAGRPAGAAGDAPRRWSTGSTICCTSCCSASATMLWSPTASRRCERCWASGCGRRRSAGW